MKKLIMFFFILILPLGTSCGYANEEKLEGTYTGKFKARNVNMVMNVIIKYQEPDYIVSYSMNNSSVFHSTLMKREGVFLVDADDSYMKVFEIKNDGDVLVSLDKYNIAFTKNKN